MESKQHTHILTPGLVGVLAKMIQAVHDKDKNEVHLQRDLDLSHNEYANAQKLRYFALIAHVEGKRGFWLITVRGGAFLRDEAAVVHKVTTQDNEIVGKSEDKRIIRDYFPTYDHAWFQTNFYSQRISNQQILI